MDEEGEIAAGGESVFRVTAVAAAPQRIYQGLQFDFCSLLSLCKIFDEFFVFLDLFLVLDEHVHARPNQLSDSSHFAIVLGLGLGLPGLSFGLLLAHRGHFRFSFSLLLQDKFHCLFDIHTATDLSIASAKLAAP